MKKLDIVLALVEIDRAILLPTLSGGPNFSRCDADTYGSAKFQVRRLLEALVSDDD